MRAVFALMSVLLLAACGGGGGGGGSGGGTPPDPATPGLASTGCGRYQGVDRGTTWLFLGIRYAAAPTGTLRWKSPASPTCPVEVVQAASFPSACPQLNQATGAVTGDEDCLALNVYTPKSAFPAGRAPVMVFIHGGGNSQGSTSEMVGDAHRRAWALSKGIIAVTI